MSADESDPGVLAKLPEDLQYLAEPALKFKLHGEFEIWPILDQMTPEQRVELETLGAKVLENGHYDKVNDFLDQYPIDKYEEAAYLYFLFGLLDYADIKFA